MIAATTTPAPASEPLPALIDPVALRPIENEIRPESLRELLSLTPDEIARVDIARANLLCAVGLPGSEDLDIDAALATLDEWAAHIAAETNAARHQFLRNPEQYRNSEAFFRMLVLVTILQRDLGCRYNPDRIRDPDKSNSKDQFLHGLVGSDNGGTCVSMPALYVAVGRRLGYPLSLVQAKTHVFCRWEEPGGERINIEGTNHGMSSYDDAHYHAWPEAITPDELARGEFMTTLTHTQELGLFLGCRGHALAWNGLYRTALPVFEAAARRMRTGVYWSWVLTTERAIAAREPFRPVVVTPPGVNHPRP